MKKRVLVNLVMAFLVAGLFFTVSCAKKTVVSDATTIEDQAKAKDKADRIAQQKFEEQLAKEQALKEAKAAAAGKRFQNQDVHFAYDSSELSSMAKILLKEKAAYLKENSLISVTVEGHCDERGTTDYNLALGERRATAVKNYLVNLGIASSRLNNISYGEEKSIDTASSENAWKKNRRAHFVIE
jgi:peptidoglycan-associated lipoprotein